MGRIRCVKPDLFRHEGLFEAERKTGLPLRVSFIGLFTTVDREGRFRWRPRQLKLDVLPFDEVDFANVLEALRTHGFIVHYLSGGEEYGAIPSWHKHQVINNRESASCLPDPAQCQHVDHASGTREARVRHATPTPLLQVQGEGEGNGNVSVASQPRPRPKAGDPMAHGTKHSVPCPYALIVDLYHEQLPTLPKVRLMPDGRQRALRKFWGWVLSSKRPDGSRRAETAEQALGWLRDYFERAANNDFITGRGQRSPEHANWRCDLDFLLTEKGMKHVIEKTEAAA